MSAKKSVKRNALGRGLGALLEDSPSTRESDFVGKGINATPAASINEILISEIETNPYQPRTEFDQEALEELAESIRVQGIIQPI